MGRMLLAADEPPPVTTIESPRVSRFVVICDHAANRIPARLDGLGLSAADLRRHVAWDIGALGVARAMASQLDATLVVQNYSRLVIDMNRAPERDDSIPVLSENIEIPGNRVLTPEDRRARQAEIFEPYHAEIYGILERRGQQGLATILVSIHSFTPAYLGAHRPWEVGVLSMGDRRVADIVLRELREDDSLTVGDNLPYDLGAGVDYTVPLHAVTRGIPHVLIEIRQDEITHASPQRQWGGRLASILRTVEAGLT